jgi:hypothetical protein
MAVVEVAAAVQAGVAEPLAAPFCFGSSTTEGSDLDFRFKT